MKPGSSVCILVEISEDGFSGYDLDDHPRPAPQAAAIDGEDEEITVTIDKVKVVKVWGLCVWGVGGSPCLTFRPRS